MSNDFHNKPFDDSTKTKLELYKEYIKAWLPVFLKSNIKNINIFDFFCGPGIDSKNTKGSPLLAIEVINSFKNMIQTQKLSVNLYLNDNDSTKIDKLTKLIKSKKLNQIDYLQIYITNKEFDFIFDKYYSSTMNEQNSANLIFIDQTGIKHVNKERFLEIVNLKRTDLLFFISSSAIKRFVKQTGFKSEFGTFSKQIREAEPRNIHREIARFYRELISKDTQYHLIPFTLKKGKNYYGLIFGTKHILGANKFLTICWNKDKITGDANFDIDNSNIDHKAPALFADMDKSNKLKEFENELKAKIINKELKSNIEIYLYTISNGFLAKHVKEVIKELLEDKSIKKKIHVSYDLCVKKKKEERINVIK